MSIQHTLFFNMEALILDNDAYSATIIPEYGCNLVTLHNKTTGLDILKTPLPSDHDEFMSAPQHFGNAILFPPNRIQNGTFTRNGRSYSFIPHNLPADKAGQYMYSHGILRYLPFAIEHCEERDSHIVVSACYHCGPGEQIYKSFPHEFVCCITFDLSYEGLQETISFTNLGDTPMPLGAGFHTAFQIPNDALSSREDYRIVWSADRHIVLSPNCLPTGELLPLKSDCRHQGIFPFLPIQDEHTTLRPISFHGKDFLGAIIKNIKTNNNIIFEIDENFGYFMLWNNKARSNYICIEPMSWMINAPNSTLPDKLSGYKELDSRTSWQARMFFSAAQE